MRMSHTMRVKRDSYGMTKMRIWKLPRKPCVWDSVENLPKSGIVFFRKACLIEKGEYVWMVMKCWLFGQEEKFVERKEVKYNSFSRITHNLCNLIALSRNKEVCIAQNIIPAITFFPERPIIAHIPCLFSELSLGSREWIFIFFETASWESYKRLPRGLLLPRDDDFFIWGDCYHECAISESNTLKWSQRTIVELLLPLVDGRTNSMEYTFRIFGYTGMMFHRELFISTSIYGFSWGTTFLSWRRKYLTKKTDFIICSHPSNQSLKREFRCNTKIF